MPSKMVALKELIFAHSSFNVGKRDTTQKYEYSRKQKQLEKTILYCNIKWRVAMHIPIRLDNDQQKYLRSNKELIVDFPIVSAFDKK